MTAKTTLEVGDKLYHYHYNTYTGPYTIERVTATQAIAGGMRFKRNLTGFSIKEIGASGYYGGYHLETPEIKLECRRQGLKSKIKNFDYSKLSLDQLERINAILTEQP